MCDGKTCFTFSVSFFIKIDSFRRNKNVCYTDVVYLGWGNKFQRASSQAHKNVSVCVVGGGGFCVIYRRQRIFLCFGWFGQYCLFGDTFDRGDIFRNMDMSAKTKGLQKRELTRRATMDREAGEINVLKGR